MARIINTEKEKRKSKFKSLFITILIILILIGGGFALWKFVLNGDNKEVQELKQIDKIDAYGYTLMSNDTDYFKNEFDSLKSILKESNVDVKTYSTQVAKMFVADLYTMNTKVNKYDIGGAEYYYADKKTMFEQKVMDTLYATILDNTYGDRKQELPEVSNISVDTVEKGTFKLGNENVESYNVVLSISYVKDLGYDKMVSVVVVQESDTNRWSVVEIKNVSNENKK